MTEAVTHRLREFLKKSESVPEVSVTSVDATSAEIPHEEPTSVALHIQSLIGALPTPASSSPVEDPNPIASDNFGPTLPSSIASQIQDSKLFAILSSPTIMNGSRNDSNHRPSVWSILEGLGPRRGDNKQSIVSNSAPRAEDSGVSNIFSDSSSIMVYSPLLPTHNSLVELADSEVIVEEEEPEVGEVESTSVPSLPGWTWASILPDMPSWLSQTRTTPMAVINENGQPRSPEIKLGMRVWVPSKNKLSIQTMWWGYRLFLPPPVLDILSDKTIEAAKRASMITAALTWFFDNLPVHAFPMVIRPTLLLLQRIAPYLGYIGTFISWSWGTIRSYDKGYGVILTATWLLPIALIPGTWFERDWPVTPPLSPAPLPSDPEPLESTTLSVPSYQHASPSASDMPIASPISSPPQLYTVDPVTPSVYKSPQVMQETLLTNSPNLSSLPSSSPALSFVTALQSPAPLSPRIFPDSVPTKSKRSKLMGLVSKSPIVRVRKITKPHDQPPSVSFQIQPQEPMYSPLVHSPCITPSTTTGEGPMIPSPPAPPDDLRLLQSPIWDCSPLPLERPLPTSDYDHSQEAPQQKRSKSKWTLKKRIKS